MRQRLGVFTVAALVVALGLMLPFENTFTRIGGVLAMFAFIVSGVFLIAGPDFFDAPGPWRERAMAGKLYSGQPVRDARSTDRRCL